MGHIAGKETIGDKVSVLLEHSHSQQKLAPSGANAQTLTSHTSAWVHGTIETLAAAGVITSDYDVHWVTVSDISANAEYEIILYKGDAGSEIEIGRCAVVRNAVQSQEGNVSMMTPLIPAGTRLSASVAQGAGGTQTLDVKVAYHTY